MCREWRRGSCRFTGPSSRRHQELIREVVLQLKEGRISARPFRAKFGVDIFEEFAMPLTKSTAAGYLSIEGDDIR